MFPPVPIGESTAGSGDLPVIPLYALHFGNEMALTQHGRALAALYPGSLTYALTEGRFYSFTREDHTDEVVNLVRQGKCVVAEGSIVPGERMILPKSVRWEPLIIKKNQAIYELTDASESLNFPAKADFRRIDSKTQGNWKGVYGSAGFIIPSSTYQWPDWAKVSMPADPPGAWVPSTPDIRALQKSAETIELADADTRKLLDTRRVASFKNGQYLVWDISGDVRVTVTRTAGANAVISGVFLDWGCPLE